MNEQEKTDFRGLVPAIAKALGATITRKPDDERYWSAKLTTAAGLPLHLSHDMSSKKLRVSVDLPPIKGHDGQARYQSSGDLMRYGKPSREGAPEPLYDIGLSPEKGAEKIAADITRRLIPGATELYARGCQRRDDSEAYTRGITETLGLLAKRLKTSVRGSTVYADSLTLEVNGPNSVRIPHLTVSAETALKICAMVRAEKSE